MHGTYHNYSPRMENGVVKELSNGDILVFGAEVKRGPETFPACAFQITYKFTAYKTRNTFNFPELSDIDDEEEYNLSDNEFNEPTSSVDGASLDSLPVQKASTSIAAIDLTQDEPLPASSTPTVQVPSILHDTNTIILLDSEEEDEPYSSESDCQSDVADSEDSEGSVASDDSEVGCQMRHEFEDTSCSGSENSEEETGRLHCESEMNLDNSARLFSSPTESSDNEENHSDFSLSEAGREGIKALFDEGLLGRQCSPDLDGNEDGSDFASVDDSTTKESKHVTVPIIRTELPPSITEPIRYDRINETYLSLRQPSPSDAAMVKPATVPILPSVSGAVKVAHLPMKEWRGLNALSSAEKARKTAFFEARYQNKAKLDSGSQEIARVSSVCIQEFPQTALERPKFVAPARDAWVRKERMGDQAPATAPVAPLSYLDDHTQAPFIERQEASPEPDMTSAVKFNESRSSMAAMNKTAAAFSAFPSGRSGLRILDIIEAPKNTKRKAEEISEVIDDEIRLWASSPTQDGTTNSTTNVSVSELNAALNSTQAKSDDVSHTSESRPMKRFKRMAECLGYAALGGAAVGAGLFSVLVATAPDFM
jgi:hypothetical protein